MTDSTDPPTHPFLEFSADYSPAGLLGLGETRPRQHDGPAMALEATLDSLDHGRPVPFTKVAEALQQPPHGHSKQAVDDLKVLLRRYLRQHSRPLRTDSTQRRYAPIAVSHRWMFVAAPHYLFRPATEEEQEQARAAEVERKLLADMPFRQRMRRLRQRRWTPPVKPKPITPSLRRAMKKALDSVKDTE